MGSRTSRKGTRVLRQRQRRWRRRRDLLLAVAAAFAVPSATARATDYFWNAPSGNWSTPANWTPAGGPPHFGDSAILTTLGATDVVVTYDPSAFAQLSQCFIDTSNSGNITLVQSQGGFNSGDEVVGNLGRGALAISGFSGHTLDPTSGTDGLFLGFNAGASGTVSLSVNSGLTVFGTEYVGYGGNGVLNQTGGVHDISGLTKTPQGLGLVIGSNTASSGTVLLSGGSLTVNQQPTYVGFNGRGDFQLSNDATHSTAGLLVGGSNALSTYTMTGGTLNNSDNEIIGGGLGSFTQSGGSHTIGGPNGLLIGAGIIPTGAGTFTLNGGYLGITNLEIVGGSLPGVFNQGGGTNIAFDLVVGAAAPGTFTLSNGALQITQLSAVALGSAGSFVQSGGTHTALVLSVGGSSAAAVGVYTMTGGSLSVFGEAIGPLGPGTMLQSGGSHTIAQLKVGGTSAAGAGLGVFGLSNGAALTVQQQESVGAPFNGVFNQTGGTHAVHGTGAATNGLFIGFNTAVASSPLNGGTFTLSGGTLTVDGNEWVGFTAGGVFNQSGGVHSVGGTVVIGLQIPGAYNMSGGTFAAAVVVNGGPYTQTGGTATFGDFEGTAAASIGGGSGSATLTVSRFTQSTLTIGSGGTFAVASNAARFTNLVDTLTINGSGVLDLGRANVQLKRGVLAASDPNSVLQQAYAKIVSAYNSPNPGIALGDWKGPGITSALAKADIALPASSRAGLAIGIWDSTDAQIQTGQPSNTVRIAMTVLGDANGDLFTDNADFAVWRNNFGTGDHWSQGDFNYDQFVDNADFGIWRNNFGNSPGFGPAAKTATSAASSPVTLSGSSHSATPTAVSAKPAAFPIPPGQNAALGTVSVFVDTNSGDVELDINLQNQSDLESVQFKSGTTNAMITANYNGMTAQGFSGCALSGAPTTRLIAEFNQLAQTPFPNETVLDFGNFWSTLTNAQNIQFTYNTTPHGGGSVVTNLGTVTYIVPEPASLGLMAIAAAGLLGRSRKKRGSPSVAGASLRQPLPPPKT